jgi:hypothetical protein
MFALLFSSLLSPQNSNEKKKVLINKVFLFLPGAGVVHLARGRKPAVVRQRALPETPEAAAVCGGVHLGPPRRVHGRSWTRLPASAMTCAVAMRPQRATKLIEVRRAVVDRELVHDAVHALIHLHVRELVHAQGVAQLGQFIFVDANEEHVRELLRGDLAKFGMQRPTSETPPREVLDAHEARASAPAIQIGGLVQARDEILRAVHVHQVAELRALVPPRCSGTSCICEKQTLKQRDHRQTVVVVKGSKPRDHS